MAYFSNGTEHEMWAAKNCNRCKHMKIRDIEDCPTCPIMEAHEAYNYEQCNNSAIKEILTILIPMTKEYFGDKCSMFELEVEKDTPKFPQIINDSST